MRCLLLLLSAACLAAAVQVIPTENAPVSRSVNTRSLLVNTVPNPNNPPISVPFDTNLVSPNPDLPPNDPRISKKGAGCNIPQQLHLTYWSPTSVLVSWVTCDYNLGPSVTGPQAVPPSTSLQYLPGDCIKQKKDKNNKNANTMSTDPVAAAFEEGDVKAETQADTAKSNFAPYKTYKKGCKPITATGIPTSYYINYTAVMPANSYASPIIHHVLLKDLTPGQTYYYKVSGAVLYKISSFTVPPQSKFPFRLGVVADPGQTENSSVVVDRLVKEQPQLVALIGDFCYADAWYNWTTRSASSWVTFQPKWDTWGNLYEPILSKVPFFHVNGNHEIEREGGTSLQTGTETARMRSYNNRYPVPQTDQQRANGPTDFSPVTSADPWRGLYWASEVPGVFKSISLTSYSPNQPMTALEQQYQWLQAELQRTDRSRTPWLIVNWHAPWYNTYNSHFKENQAMRATYESLLVQYKVDIIFNGHVHAYERKTPISSNQVSTDGPVSITIGDGGNVEGLYKEFVDVPVNSASWNRTCLNNGAQYTFPWYQPAPPNYQFFEPTGQWCPGGTAGCWCYGVQPSWSAYREPSFGYGVLEFSSATEATWTWHKNQKPAWEIGDQVKVIRSA